jgi:hypothetical protein
VKLGKKLLGENDIEAVLQRVDRLTQEEVQTTGAQTLELVYGLVKNIKIVMDGARGLPAGSSCRIDYHIFIQGRASEQMMPTNLSVCLVLLMACALDIDSSASTHPAAHEGHKQIETCVQFLRYKYCRR